MSNSNLNSNSEIYKSQIFDQGFMAVDPKSWDVLPKETQDQNIKDAFDYLQLVISDWKEKRNGNVVSLAKLANRWSAKTTPKARKKHLQTEINDFNRMIERRKKIGEPFERYAEHLAMLAEELRKLTEKYPEL